MRHAVLTTVRIGVLIGMLISPRGAISGEARPLDRARTLIAAHNEQEAAEILEDALSGAAKADRGAILSLLRETYSSLAKQAQEKGRDREAALYRDNLAILDRETSVTSPAPVVVPKPAPERSSPAPAMPRQLDTGTTAPKPAPIQISPELEGPSSKSTPSPRQLPDPEPLAPAGAPKSNSLGTAAPSLPDTEPAPSTEDVARPQADPRPEGPSIPKSALSPELTRQIKQADQAFHEKHYSEAGRLYAQIASRKELPSNRKEVWAYCRWTEVVRKMNAKPRSAKDWDAIEAEIKSIRELNPNNWYGEYLLSKVAEARKTRRSLFPSRAKNEKLVVRGSEPEEIDVNLPTESTPKPKPKAAKAAPRLDVSGSEPEPMPMPAITPQPRGEAIEPEAIPNEPAAPASSRSTESTTSNGRWQVRETPNFRIFHNAPEVAERAAQIAESVRATQGQRWTSPAVNRTWSPKCDLYLYPDSKIFAKMTGQPETSPGFTTMGANAGKIISRRVNLRADHPQLLTAVLPHEITHVVLADMFPDQPIPRWADEGMAVLAEPPAELQSRAAELNGPLQENRLFALNDLVALDYPDSKDWSTYYSQSVSLTRFLMDQGQPRDFIRFLQATQRSGIDAALRSIYRINDLAELQNQWLTYAREQASRSDVAHVEPAQAPLAEVEPESR